MNQQLATYCDPQGAVSVPRNPAVPYRFTDYFNRLPLPTGTYQIRLVDFAP